MSKTRNDVSSKARRQGIAQANAEERAKRSEKKQLAILKERPGSSTKETARLKVTA